MLMTTSSVKLAVGAAVLALSSGMAASCGGTRPTPFKPVVDNKMLMDAVLEPNALVVWEAVGTVSTLEGVEERRPESADEWTAIRNSAVTVTEAGNLLMLAPRAQDGEEWVNAARELIKTGETVIRQVDAKNADGLLEAGGELYNACVRCHVSYMPGAREAYTSLSPAERRAIVER